MLRVRQCLECPRCRIRYVISRGPYQNGSYIVSAAHGHGDEYILYCSSCGVGSRWMTTEAFTCEVSKPAYQRGYGTKEEVVSVGQEAHDTWPIECSSPPDDWKSTQR